MTKADFAHPHLAAEQIAEADRRTWEESRLHKELMTYSAKGMSLHSWLFDCGLPSDHPAFQALRDAMEAQRNFIAKLDNFMTAPGQGELKMMLRLGEDGSVQRPCSTCKGKGILKEYRPGMNALVDECYSCRGTGSRGPILTRQIAAE